MPFCCYCTAGPIIFPLICFDQSNAAAVFSSELTDGMCAQVYTVYSGHLVPPFGYRPCKSLWLPRRLERFAKAWVVRAARLKDDDDDHFLLFSPPQAKLRIASFASSSEPPYCLLTYSYRPAGLLNQYSTEISRHLAYFSDGRSNDRLKQFIPSDRLKR